MTFAFTTRRPVGHVSHRHSCLQRLVVRAEQTHSPVRRLDRRAVLTAYLAVWGATQFGGAAEAALVMMPATTLRNRYYLLRAGESVSEAEGRIDTNPVNKTSMSNGLSDEGKRQILKDALPKLREMGACRSGCWLWPSTTQNAYQTAELIAYAFQLGRERIVPEYSFLDMRGLGAFDGLAPTDAYDRIHDLDQKSAALRPPPTTTGTPNESTADVFVRVRQLLSLLETQYLGADVIVISPDSENLSVLQTAILGEERSTHWKRSFAPGEVRALELAETREELKSFVMDCPKPPNCV